MTNRAAIYVRSSPDCPLTADEQIDRLTAAATECGWTVVQVFTDRPTSIRKSADRRTGEVALIEAIRSGTIDRVLLWSICRVGKSLPDLVGFMETCRSADVSLWIDEQRIDTAASNELSLFDLSELMALHLRQSRRGKILQGLAAAKSLSIRIGRPPIPLDRIQKAKVHLATGKGVRETARLVGISAASASRLKDAAAATGT